MKVRATVPNFVLRLFQTDMCGPNDNQLITEKIAAGRNSSIF